MSEIRTFTCDLCKQSLNVEKWEHLSDWAYLKLELRKNDGKDVGFTGTVDVCDKCYKKVHKLGLDDIVDDLAKLLESR